jgi:hypothetical protein
MMTRCVCACSGARAAPSAKIPITTVILSAAKELLFDLSHGIHGITRNNTESIIEKSKTVLL